MHSRTRKLVVLFAFLFAWVAIAPPSLPAGAQEIDLDDVVSATANDIWCWCTEFVKRARNLSPDYPNAGDWNDGYLQRNGFVQRFGAPQKGDVVVFEANNSMPYGHVGIFKRAEGGNWLVLGANQGDANWKPRQGCYNTNKVWFRARSSAEASFWYRP